MPHRYASLVVFSRNAFKLWVGNGLLLLVVTAHTLTHRYTLLSKDTHTLIHTHTHTYPYTYTVTTHKHIYIHIHISHSSHPHTHTPFETRPAFQEANIKMRQQLELRMGMTVKSCMTRIIVSVIGMVAGIAVMSALLSLSSGPRWNGPTTVTSSLLPNIPLQLDSNSMTGKGPDIMTNLNDLNRGHGPSHIPSSCPKETWMLVGSYGLFNNMLISVLKFIVEAHANKAGAIILQSYAAKTIGKFNSGELQRRFPCTNIRPDDKHDVATQAALNVVRVVHADQAFSMPTRWGPAISALRPLPATARLVDNIRRNALRGSYIALHLRHMFGTCEPRTKLFIKKFPGREAEMKAIVDQLCPLSVSFVRQLIANTPLLNHVDHIFVASDGDRPDIEKALQHEFGDRLVMGGQDVLADFFLMASAPILIANPLSTMSVNACLFVEEHHGVCFLGQSPGEDWLGWFLNKP
jgi:hypothetical protein